MISTETAILVGAALATTGWIYTARRARILARKQHTINIMLQASFNKEFRDALASLAPHLKAGKCPDLFQEDKQELREHFRFIMNHYEFVAIGIRNGDIDEKLVLDSERGTFLSLVETCQNYIYTLRDTHSRQTIYEHLVWLRKRWEMKPPGRPQRMVEYLLARPFPGKRVSVTD